MTRTQTTDTARTALIGLSSDALDREDVDAMAHYPALLAQVAEPGDLISYAVHAEVQDMVWDEFCRHLRARGLDLSTEDTDMIEIVASARVADICVALSRYDHGDGCLGIIVRQALADDPDATVEDIAAICEEAEQDADRERDDR